MGDLSADQKVELIACHSFQHEFMNHTPFLALKDLSYIDLAYIYVDF